MMMTMMMAMMIMIMILTIMLTMVMTMSTKANLNSIIMDPDDAPCYCDHNCLNMGDCCPDFKDYCGVIDCQVSSWSSWGSCSSECGSGKATRTRTVIRPQSNGGVSCPDLIEKKSCQGESDSCTRREEKH